MIKRILIALLVSSGLKAQTLPQFPRTTSTTGLNDSSLAYCTDSAYRTRACSFLEYKRALARGASLDSLKVVLTPTAHDSSTHVANTGYVDRAVATGHGLVSDSATGAARAQKLTTARTIGGTSFDGTANIVPGLADSSTGSTRAQKLTTARTINGTSFDGTGNITITAAANTLTGTTLASGVTGSSLTTFGVGALTDSTTGAARAQTLTTARTIGGTSFNGSANITPGLADSSTGSTRAATLTTARTIGGVSFNGSANTTVATATGGFTVTGGSLVTGRDSIVIGTALVFAGSDTVKGQPAWVSTQTFATGQKVDSAASVTTTVLSGVVGTTQTSKDSSTKIATTQYVDKAVSAGGVTYPLKAPSGTALAPSYSFTGTTDTTGIFRVGLDTLGFSTAGVQSFRMSGGATAKLVGGAGNTTFQCGTGNSRTCTFQPTDAGGTPVSALTMSSSALTLGVDTLTNSGVLVAQHSSGMTLRVEALGANADATVDIVPNASNGTGYISVGNSQFIQMPRGGSSVNLVKNGSASGPALAWSNSVGSGFYRFGADTIGIATGGVHSLRISGGASVKFTGGAGNSTWQAGTGASRTFTIATTTSGSTATNALTINNVQQMVAQQDGSITAPQFTFASNTGTGLFSSTSNGAVGLTAGNTLSLWTDGSVDSLPLRMTVTGKINGSNGTASLPGYSFINSTNSGTYLINNGSTDTLAISVNGTNRLKIMDNPATGVGDVQACLSTANLLTQGAACGSSTRAIKTDIGLMPTGVAVDWVMRMKPSFFRYKDNYYGGRKDLGFIAEDMANIDARLAIYAQRSQTLKDGTIVQDSAPININERAILATVTATVQLQQQLLELLQARLDKLCTKFKEACP